MLMGKVSGNHPTLNPKPQNPKTPKPLYADIKSQYNFKIYVIMDKLVAFTNKTGIYKG